MCEDCRVDPVYIKSETNPNPPKVPFARYNFKTKDAKPLVCTTHKVEGMLNVSIKRCEGDGCILKASFNEPGNIVARFCESCAHKFLDKYMHVWIKCPCGKRLTLCDDCKYCPHNLLVDDCLACCKGSHKCKTCIENYRIHTESDAFGKIDPPEIKRATFNIKGGKPIVCSEHKLKGMINTVAKKCETEDCDTIPVYNEPGKAVGRFCKKCAEKFLDEYEDVLTPKCKCGKIASICSDCDIGRSICMLCCTRRRNANCKYTYKPEPAQDVVKTTTICGTCHLKLQLAELIRQAKTPKEIAKILKRKAFIKMKELTITNTIMNSFPRKTWHRQAHVPNCDPSDPLSQDKRYFTDLEWDISSSDKDVFEIDENQHHLMRCDLPRCINIVAANVGQRVTFIRFNPDKYKYQGKTVKGMFTCDDEITDVYEERMQQVLKLLKNEHQRALSLEKEDTKRLKLAELGGVVTPPPSVESLIRIVFINYDEDSSAVKYAIDVVGEAQVVTHWID